MSGPFVTYCAKCGYAQPNCACPKRVDRNFDPDKLEKKNRNKHTYGNSILKFDKVDLTLIPKVSQEAEAVCHMEGSKKHGGQFNWIDGKNTTARSIASGISRHLNDWLDGQEFDEDGQHNLGCIKARATMLLELLANGNLKDDRCKK